MVYLSGRRLTWSFFLRKGAASTTVSGGCKSLMSLQSDLLLVVAASAAADDHHHHQHQEVMLRKVQNCRESNDENARDMAIYMFCLQAIGKSYR